MLTLKGNTYHLHLLPALSVQQWLWLWLYNQSRKQTLAMIGATLADLADIITFAAGVTDDDTSKSQVHKTTIAIFCWNCAYNSGEWAQAIGTTLRGT